jgi:threonine-phosphate decarboxylase
MTAVHGGDVAAIARAFGCDAATLLDFSANINPAGPPAGVAALLRSASENPAMLAAYPDPHARELCAALAAREGVGAERIVVANGSAALIDVCVRVLRTRRCVVPVPAFSEYARALAAAGAAMIPVPLRPEDDFALDPERLLAAARAARADACIVCNPHNPTGRGEPAGAIAALAASLARIGCATILDEAFADYAPECGMPAAAAGEHTVIVRSLTKFFALPGMRIGYGIAPAAAAERVRAALPSWPVGTLDQRAALAVLADSHYAEETIRRNRRARSELTGELAALGARVFPAAANFIYCDLEAVCRDVVALRDALVREHGIIIRTFERDAAPSGAYVRVAVRLPAENARLIAALRACTNPHAREGARV